MATGLKNPTLTDGNVPLVIWKSSFWAIAPSKPSGRGKYDSIEFGDRIVWTHLEVWLALEASVCESDAAQ